MVSQSAVNRKILGSSPSVGASILRNRFSFSSLRQRPRVEEKRVLAEFDATRGQVLSRHIVNG